MRVGIVLRNRPGPLAALVATLGTGREVVTLSPHLGDIGLERDIVELAPDVVVAEDEDWARDAVLASSRRPARSRCGPGPTGPWRRSQFHGHRARRCRIPGTSPC